MPSGRLPLESEMVVTSSDHCSGPTSDESRLHTLRIFELGEACQLRHALDELVPIVSGDSGDPCIPNVPPMLSSMTFFMVRECNRRAPRRHGDVGEAARSGGSRRRTQGERMRPGAPLAPFCVWHELHWPFSGDADIAFSFPCETTFTWNGAAMFPS